MPDQASTPGGGWVPVPDPTILTTAAVAETTKQYRRELVQLREILDQRISMLSGMLDERYATQTKATDAAFAAQQTALLSALAATDKRFDAVNEFRQQQSDLIRNFLPRAEYETAHTSLEVAVADVRSRMDTMGGTIVPRNETDAWRNALLAKIDDLSKRMDVEQGSGKGAREVVANSRAQIAIIIAAIAAIAAIASIIVYAFHR